MPTLSEEGLSLFLGKTMPLLDERQRRLMLGSLATAIGRGGITFLQEVTGVSRVTLTKGQKESEELECDPKARPSIEQMSPARKEGGGRKTVNEAQPEIKQTLLSLLDGSTVGNPENPLCWTTLSTYDLADALKEKGFKVSPTSVRGLLKELGFSLQLNRKFVEKGSGNDDRDAQFQNINENAKRFMAQDCPVLSIDAKKKELVGNYKNNGQEYRPKGDARKVACHDFMGELGKATPFGVYDVNANVGFVNVGVSSDTAEFAVKSIRQWYLTMGSQRYPNAKRIMITADGGGSNGSRNRLFKRELQKFATEFQLEVHVFHYPPGTSKWNKIEHRLFAQISRNWRGKPLETLQVIVNLIAATKTETGLKVECKIDPNEYKTGIKVDDKEMAGLNLLRKAWRGDWNYVICPGKPNELTYS